MLIVVSAPSGAGKTTLCREITKVGRQVGYSISHTTRAPRPGERDGHDFHFVAEADSGSMIDRGEFAEWARVHGNLYGTAARRTRGSARERGEDMLLDIDTHGARQLRDRYPHGVFVFVVAPSMQELELRLRERRSDAPQEIGRRMTRAVDEIGTWHEYDYLIVNRDLDEALGQLRCLIVAERCRTSQWRSTFPINPPRPGPPHKPAGATPKQEP